MNRKTFVVLALAACLVAVAPAFGQVAHIDHNNQLFVSGTETEDEIILTSYRDGGALVGVAVSVNGVDFGQWPMRGVSGITVRGLGGDDRIDASGIRLRSLFLHEQPEFTITITGDGGHDTIVGSPAKDVIYGHEGNDDIRGARGADVLLGGPGNDVLRGGGGHDVIEGEAGDHDRLFGGFGNDRIGDKDGARVINGGDGEDKITLVLHEAWTPWKPRARALLIGGADADDLELINRAAYAIRVLVDGDQRHGYPGEGDRLIVSGHFDGLLEVVNVEDAPAL